MVQLVLMKGVRVDDRVPLACDTNYLTLLGVKLHHPGSLPFFEQVKVILEHLCVFAVLDCQVDHSIVGEGTSR